MYFYFIISLGDVLVVSPEIMFKCMHRFHSYGNICMYTVQKHSRYCEMLVNAWFALLLVLQCFDSVSWLTGTASGKEKPVTSILSRDKWREKIKGKPDNTSSPRKRSVKENQWFILPTLSCKASVKGLISLFQYWYSVEQEESGLVGNLTEPWVAFTSMKHRLGGGQEGHPA